MVRVLMKTNGGYRPQHGQGGCLDGHQVQVLAQDVGMGTGARVHQLAIDGSSQCLAQGDQGHQIAYSQAIISMGGYRT